jgi:hypothetical protein
MRAPRKELVMTGNGRPCAILLDLTPYANMGYLLRMVTWESLKPTREEISALLRSCRRFGVRNGYILTGLRLLQVGIIGKELRRRLNADLPVSPDRQKVLIS